jgi:hypothetical protein
LIEETEDFRIECGDLCDVDGDGKPQEVVPHATYTFWYEAGTLSDGQRGIVKHEVSREAMHYGTGCGDVNGDGRPDLLRPDAWFEAPPDPRNGTWKKHPWKLGSKAEGKSEHTPQIWAYDVDADGLSDIVTSSAHRHGIFWYRQIRDGKTRDGSSRRFEQHVIDDSWSQAHSITLADIDDDGDLDLVTGKRFMAHDGGDPDAFKPLGVYWYELSRKPKVRWTKHAISFDQGIGSGVNIPVVDLEGDGDLDILVNGKWGGPVWFKNKLK